jgi:hypothetical protein
MRFQGESRMGQIICWAGAVAGAERSVRLPGFAWPPVFSTRQEVQVTNYRLKLTAAALGGLAYAVSPAFAEESEAKAVFKAMSEFLAAQQTVSVSYDATLEIVTAEMMKVGLASSGKLSFSRPDKIRMTRTGGLADVEMVFDGKTLSASGKNLNVFARMPVEGTLDTVVAKLRDEFGLELPAADLLSSAPYEVMMENVVVAMALGEGMIRGEMCDHLAFRTDDVDWQIWVSQGDKPFPCRFTITSKMTALAPSYSIEFSGWKTGADVAADDFQLKPAADAKEVAITELRGLNDVPAPAAEGDAQ